ncbi:isoaspartyl peptidase/L-asparaginase family protein [Sphingobacterium sp. HJSM2_6]|uniref:isoaspartyl peptidase/L-asparaginase family protein n=1 Tax=Sphingobacterium sp. HJSM2_6 TaxID=3366264 RepID=UPI003BCDB6E5
MMRSIFFILLFIAICVPCQDLFAQSASKPRYILAIHGGAGTILKKNMTVEMEKEYTNTLKLALSKGYEALKAGKSSVEAIAQTITILEDSPLFNAGKGAVFTNDGKNELDASIMDGANLKAGAVAGVTTIKNPIKAAIAVMQHSEHVMMVGAGAAQFAKSQHLEIVDPSYFWTKARWDALQKAKARDKERAELDHNANHTAIPEVYKDEKFGTVGCVALDRQGNLAAGTSTGGMTNKKFGRVGDAPIIGAGTYANNQSVAVSCTGWGEFFIRSVAAYQVSARMLYAKQSVEEAARGVIDEIGKMGGDGGLIALDKDGKLIMPFNTEGMYRGSVAEDGTISVEIYK